MESQLLRVQEAAKLLKVSKWTVYRWIDEGRLRGTKIGQGSLRVFRISVDELIEKTKIDGEVIRANVRKQTPATDSAKKKPR